MSNELSADEIEIIQDFLQESRDMIDQLEPTIIELGQSCQDADCWATVGCDHAECHRHGKSLAAPCWLDVGYIDKGAQTCPYGESAADCLACPAFSLVNGDVGTMNAIFRLFHSMKGSAGFLELNNIAHVAHAAESLLDLIRSGKIRMEAGHVDLLCQSCDFAKDALDLVESDFNDQGMEEQAEAITATLEKATEDALEAAKAPPLPQSEEPPREAPQTPELLLTPEMVERFVLEGDELLQNAEQGLLNWSAAPEDLECLAGLFRDIHSFKGNCGFLGYGELERLSHQMETVLDAAKSGSAMNGNKAAEYLLTKLDLLRAGIADISKGGPGSVDSLDEHVRGLAELLSPDSKGEEAEPAQAVAEAPAAAEPPQPKETPEPAPAKAASPEPAQPKAPPKPAPAKAAPKAAPKAAVTRQDIRVDLDKLDSLINIIGELVIAENMLIHNPDLQGLELESFNKAGQQMSKIVRELQELAMTIRMIPVSGLFRRMIRLVHDLSAKSGKKVDLQLVGEDTELDKTVIETITDPMVHLIRNSLDHGLEGPEERTAAGKSEKGTLNLTARHEEGEVWITIEDNGRGLNREKILEKAIKRGLVEGDGSDMSDKAVANLIFNAGFSTADKVTDISGRGVGMDVVKQNLEKIKGKIEIQSKEGGGTRTTLRIPLTLGIIDGMMVRVGDSKCIVPTLAIKQAFRPLSEGITTTPDGQELARVRENFFPVVRLHDVLQKQSEAEQLHDGILIILENQENSIALFVDEILGQQQTVIKGLSDYLSNVGSTPWVSGCTILGDGEVCLILDVGHLIEMMGQETAVGA